MNEEKVNKEFERMQGELSARKMDKIARTSKLISLILIPVLFFLFVYGSLRLNKLYQEFESVQSQKQAEEIRLQNLVFENRALEEKKVQLEKELMSTYGLSVDNIRSISTNEVLEKSLSANEALKKIVSRYSPASNTVIRYYQRTIDEKRVALELQALGYRFDEKPAAEYMSRRETNAIWYGADVPLEDIKIVSLALLRAGVPIKGIRPYRRSLTDQSYKRNMIEVGASVDLEEKEVLSVNEVEKAETFGR